MYIKQIVERMELYMQSPNVILYEYDQMLLGKAKNFKISFQGSPNSEQNKRELQIVWRYAFEKLLGWTPAQAIELVNNELVVSLMLDVTLSKAGIRFNPKKDFDFRAVLQYVYPERVKYSIEQDAISEFERVNALGKWEGTVTERRFPKGFFNGFDGDIRSSAILLYAISLYLSDKDVFELYRFFATTPEAMKWLKKLGIKTLTTSYRPTPMACLHSALPADKKDSVYLLNEFIINELGLPRIDYSSKKTAYRYAR